MLGTFSSDNGLTHKTSALYFFCADSNLTINPYQLVQDQILCYYFSFCPLIQLHLKINEFKLDKTINEILFFWKNTPF